MNTIGHGWEADQLTDVVVEHRSLRCRRRGRHHVRQLAVAAGATPFQTSARPLSTPLAYLWVSDRARSTGPHEQEGS